MDPLDYDRAIGELVGKVDGLITMVERNRLDRREWERDLDAKLFGADGAFVRHSRRLGALERWQARGKGVLWALGIVWAALMAAVAWLTAWWPRP